MNAHDFVEKERGRAAPCGIYHVAANAGWVSLGIDDDGADFMVNSIHRWQEVAARERHGAAERVMITADVDGAKESRVRSWKLDLQIRADESGLILHIRQYPPGVPKWKKSSIACSATSPNTLRSKLLVSRLAVVYVIAPQTIKTVLRARCVLLIRSAT